MRRSLVGVRCRAFRFRRAVAVMLALLAGDWNTGWAHSGPPYPIVVDQRVGACLVSLWGDPDVGVGTFFFTVEPVAGQEVPGSTTIQVTVQPVTKRLAPATHPAKLEKGRTPVQFTAEIPFDAQERWSLVANVQCGEVGGALVAEVEVTPDGLDLVSVMLYFFPFLFIAVLWTRAIFRRRAIDRKQGSQTAAA